MTLEFKFAKMEKDLTSTTIRSFCLPSYPLPPPQQNSLKEINFDSVKTCKSYQAFHQQERFFVLGGWNHEVVRIISKGRVKYWYICDLVDLCRHI